eukprot:1158237-Pelagomonas_calceolata.AAC.2
MCSRLPAVTAVSAAPAKGATAVDALVWGQWGIASCFAESNAAPGAVLGAGDAACWPAAALVSRESFCWLAAVLGTCEAA